MRKIKHIILFIGLILQSLPCFGSTVRINEIATEESGLNSDWVEIFIASGTVDLSGWSLYEKSSLVKTFPSEHFIFSSGTYLVIHFKSSQSDETTITGDNNNNSYVDSYTTDSGLTGTSNVITLRDSDGIIKDAVVYHNGSSWVSSQQDAFNIVVSTGQWTGTINGGSDINFNESILIEGGIGAGNSIGRDKFSNDTNDPTQDWTWFHSNQTQGFVNPSIEICPPGSGIINGLITEVSPSRNLSQGGDFIEIYVTEQSNLCGVQLYEDNALIKTFPSVATNRSSFGSYILFHAGIKESSENQDDSNATGDHNLNGIIDLYSEESSPGLIGSTDNTLTLKDSNGVIIDFMSYVNKDSLYKESLKEQYDIAVTTGQWNPFCIQDQTHCYISGSIAWSNLGSKSLFRKLTVQGKPLDSNPSVFSDWLIGTPTPGKGYGVVLTQEDRMLDIYQSPFSPYGDGQFSETIISYLVQKNSQVLIKIFDISGKMVKVLLENNNSLSDEIEVLTWDGQDDNNRIVPTGIYIVSLEARSSGGKVHRKIQTVVVARQL